MPMKVLLVEDNPADARMVQELLRAAGGQQVALRHTARLGTALETLKTETPDGIILDLALPDSKGLTTFRKIQSQISSVPIVVLTGLDDGELAVKAIAEGAADYLLKDDLSGELLVRALRYGMERKRVEETLRRTQQDLAFKNRIAHLFLIVPNDELYAAVLDAVLEFTESEDGLFGYLDAEGVAVCAEIRGARRTRPAPPRIVRLAPADWSGVWGQALREKRLVCSNQAGSNQAARALAVPLLDGGSAIGLLSVAGRKADFGRKDGEFLEGVAAYLAPGLHARMQRDAHEKALGAAVAAKEVLLREVHHRVKNNLQIIASLLNMQAEMVPEALQSPLDDCQRRVRSMALVHEQLYTGDQPDQLDFGEYVAGLANDLFAAYSIHPSAVQLRLDLDPVLLHVDQAVPCGLILNELMTNALKHGFPDERAGEIRIDLHSRQGQVILGVADTGIGLPPDFDWRQRGSLGLRIVDILRLQLNGRLECRTRGGAGFTLTFPES